MSEESGNLGYPRRAKSFGNISKALTTMSSYFNGSIVPADSENMAIRIFSGRSCVREATIFLRQVSGNRSLLSPSLCVKSRGGELPGKQRLRSFLSLRKGA